MYVRDRVDIPVPLPSGTVGETYLSRLSKALDKIEGTYRLTFIVAGTDTLMTDKLGALCLTIEDVAHREEMTLKALAKHTLPTVVLVGGGYSKDSAKSVIQALTYCAELTLA